MEYLGACGFDATAIQPEVTVRGRVRAGHIGLELVRTGLPLFVALIALIGGVQDKIATLPFAQALLAVLVIGLTADTIQNLFVK